MNTFAWYLNIPSIGLGFAFISMMVENLGIPIPTEIGYLAAIALLRAQTASFGVILFILTLGHVFGSLIAYYLGARGDEWLEGKLKNSSQFHMAKTRIAKWYEKYGALTVFACRFIGYVRPWSSFVAGFAHFPFGPFIALTAIGSLLFNLIALYFSDQLIYIWNKYETLHLFILISVGLSFGALFIYAGIQKTRSRRHKQ